MKSLRWLYLTFLLLKFICFCALTALNNYCQGRRRTGHHRFRRGGSLVPHTNVNL